jgi:hypothetical protein
VRALRKRFWDHREFRVARELLGGALRGTVPSCDDISNLGGVRRKDVGKLRATVLAGAGDIIPAVATAARGV